MFPDSDVRQSFKQYVRMQLWTDRGVYTLEAAKAAGRSPGAELDLALRLRRERFNTISRPVYVVLDPTGRELARVGGALKAQGRVGDFKALLARHAISYAERLRRASEAATASAAPPATPEPGAARRWPAAAPPAAELPAEIPAPTAASLPAGP